MNKFLQTIKFKTERKINRAKYNYTAIGNEDIKINIVCFDREGWILNKFAQEMKKNLDTMTHNIRTTISDKPDPKADINHYIIFSGVSYPLDSSSTTMITHVDCMQKISVIKNQTENGSIGICMSNDTVNKLVQNGIRRDRLCYINPAQDGMIKPKKYVIGITHRTYEYDNRKRDNAIIDVCSQINPAFFKIKIMGSGWDSIVEEIEKLGFEIEYFPEFNKEIYNDLIPSLDFFYYDGTDEGNMGYLDALAAGIKTIVTPQGYHLDMGKATHFCNTVSEFADVLNNYAQEREKICASVQDYTWFNYAYKHLEIWYYMTKKKNLSEILQNRTLYADGIFSMMLSNIQETEL